ncbi:MAG TPA: histidine kinase [Chitinophagaceae bacterium]|jgi:hypothetical protein|nr:histidine kinase [Chitinophagaceae bacterium]
MPRSGSDTGIRIISPLVLIIVSGIGQQALLPPLTADKAALMARITFFITLNFELGRQCVLLARRKYPALQQTRRRIWTAYFLCSVLALVLITASTLVNRLFMDRPLSFLSETLVNALQALWMAALVIAPYEVLYTYTLSVRSEQEKEALLKENAQSRLRILQAQVNPHFLFNSLNTLSSLIIKNPPQAEAFVEELSSVYRYLLKNSEERLSELREELQFLQSYTHLLHTRFGAAFRCSVDVDPALEHYRLPPLALQVLVENAVKHNEITEAHPLQLQLRTEGECLVVTNTLRRKRTAPPSNGFGLSGIVSRYRLVDGGEVSIGETETEFRVALPLLKPGTHETANHRG